MASQPQFLPDVSAITADLEWTTRRWGELSIPCMLELRSFNGDTPPTWAQFTPSRLADAVEWAYQQNLEGRNVYVVRNPIALSHKGAATDASIVAAFYCWADCDGRDAADNVRRFDGPKWTASVTTGKTPETRVHVYWELVEPVRNLDAWRRMQVSIAEHFHSDAVVVNPSRIMRVGGTVSYPPAHKLARGYVVESCKLHTVYNDDREPVEFERLLRVFGAGSAEAKPAVEIDTGDHHHKTADEYADILRRARTDGEKHSGVRDLAASLAGQGVSRTMAEAIVRDACPVWDRNVEHLLDSAYQKFYRHFDGTGQDFEPDPEPDPSKSDDGDDQEPRDVSPLDIWGTFPIPALPRGLLPRVLEDFAFIQGKQMGADPGGLAAAALCVCCAAIPDDVKLKVKKHEEWRESARIWVALVGNPSTKKSPILSVAERQLRKIDTDLLRNYIKRKSAYDALKKEEKSEVDRPRQMRKRLEDVTIEAAQEVMVDSTDGMLLVQDELSSWFGGMDRYSNGKGKDRGFWLQAYNGGTYTYNRIGRGAGMIDNLSVCVLGGIQPEPIRGIVADAHDDGLIQRLLPIVLAPASLGDEDAPHSDARRAYDDLVTALIKVEIDPPSGFINVGDKPCLTLSAGAQSIRRELEERHLALSQSECISRKFMAHIGKYDGLFARLCVAFHAIEYACRGLIPPEVSEETARRVAEFMRRFLLPHAVAFYGSILGMGDDHDRLASVAGYILAHGLETVSIRDVARGDGTMRRLTRTDTLRIFDTLEALGWVVPQPTPARMSVFPKWKVNPAVHAKFAAQRDAEIRRRAEARRSLTGLKGEKDV